MAVPLRIQPKQLSALEVIRDLDEAGRNALEAAIRDLGLVFDPKQLRAALERVVPADKADSLVHLLLLLSNYAAVGKLTAQDVIDRITLGLGNVPEKVRWNKDQLGAWEQAKPFFGRILGIESIRFLAKALQLEYEYDHLLRRSRIVTDIRPVFGDADEDIRGVVISQTLRLEYSTGDDQQTISLAIDASDIRGLKEACERALRKADAVRVLFEERCKMRVGYARGGSEDAGV